MYFKSHSFKSCVGSTDADLYGFVWLLILNGTKRHIFSYDSTNAYLPIDQLVWITVLDVG